MDTTYELNFQELRDKAAQDYSKQPVNEDAEVTLFNTLDYNHEDHKEGLLESANSKGENRLVCVVDEEAGGIIAYAISEENAVLISQALLFYQKHLVKQNKKKK